MGETQSSQKGTAQVILKILDEELEIWNRNVKNLKESLNKQQTLVPAYLRQQIEETEARWRRMKSLIPPLTENDNPQKYFGTTVQNVSHCLKTSADSNFVKTNNEKIPRSRQKTLSKKERLQESTMKLYMTSRIQEASSNLSGKEIENTIETCNPQLTGSTEGAHKAFLEKMIVFEEESAKENAQLKTENRKLTELKIYLEEHIKHLERYFSAAQARNKELETHQFECNSKRYKDSLQKSPPGARKIENKTEDTWTLKYAQMEDDVKRKHQDLLDEKIKIQELNENLENPLKALQVEKDELLKRSKEESEKCVTSKREEYAEQHDKNILQWSPSSEPKKQNQLENTEEQYGQMIEEFKRNQAELLNKMDMLKEHKINVEIYAKKLKTERDELLNRLSKMAGGKLIDNNPAITDLSDKNRPVKLGEFYSEIYDNEWTDAFEAIKAAGYEEKKAVETLRLTLQHVMKYCERKSDHLLKKSSDALKTLFEEFDKPAFNRRRTALHLSMPQNQAQEVLKTSDETSWAEDMKMQQRWKSNLPQKDTIRIRTQIPKEKTRAGVSATLDVQGILIKLNKEIATNMAPVVQQGYLDANNWGNDCIEDLKPYIKKCLHLGWMMVVQSPPMVLHNYPDEKEIPFDKNMYKEYTASGSVVSYIVWPALLLNEKGPLVCKGVAEGKKIRPGNSDV